MKLASLDPSMPEHSAVSRRRALHTLATGAALLALGGPAARAQTAADKPAAAPAFDPGLLARAAETARGFGQIHGIIIARRGEIAFSQAVRGPALDRAVNVKSVSKSFVAALAGAAIDRGVVRGVEQTLGDIAPRLIPEGADPKVKDLTVANLLTMQAGLERTSGPAYGRWVESRDWVGYALDRPFIAEPGERMLYSTGSYHVLGAALVRASGKTLHALAREWIGAPLGIAVPPWRRDPQGFYFGGNDMVLSPMGMLAFGEMHRLGGMWRGRRVLSERWIQEAFTPRTMSPYSGDEYGYGWFIADADGRRFVYARGYGGQMIYIVPSLEITVVVTSDPNLPARSDGYVGDLRRMLIDDIIPAAVQASA